MHRRPALDGTPFMDVDRLVPTGFRSPRRPERLILVEAPVDEDAGVLDTVRSGLSDVEVTWVRTLGAALAHLAAQPVDGVLLDLSLPGQAAEETLEALLTMAGGVPVVVLVDDEVRGWEAVQQGAADHLRRSELSTRVLRQVVELALERHRTTEAVRRSAAHADAVLSALADGVVVKDAQNRIVSVNPAGLRLLGRTAEELIGHDPGDEGLQLVHLDGRPMSREEVPSFRTLRTGEATYGEVIGVRRPDGSVVWLEQNTHVLTAPGGEDVAGVITSLRDISARLAAEEATRFQAALLDAVGQAVIATDPTGRVTYWNRAAERLYGWAAAEVLGRDLVEVTPAFRSAEQAAEVTAAVQAGRSWTGEVQLRRRDGSVFPALVTDTPLLDAAGEVVGVIGASTDLTEHRELQRTIEHQALHDGLTGLPNRALLADRLDQALAVSEALGTSVALLFLDLDHFKMINDAAGHSVGDAVLVEVARRLRGAVRPSDTVARFGGDEFVVLSLEADREAAEQLADRIRGDLSAPLLVAGRELYPSVTIGIALTPVAGADQLLSQADAAMYDAKSRGRATVSVFEDSLSRQAHEQLELSNDLRRALDGDALQVHYQPVVSLDTGALVGVEALSRWHHPVQGWVPPDRFIAVAEATGLIGALDRWVLGRAARDAGTLRDAGVLPEGLRVAVNLSARNVAGADLPGAVREAVERAGVGVGALSLELTETGVMADPDNAALVLAELRDLGVEVAVDDFGTGYSSLAYLRRLPVSTIKIDRSFVRDLVTEPDALAIVGSIVDLARSLRLATVAEGVETPEQLATLRRLGCTQGQGFLWSPAVSVPELVAMLGAGAAGRWKTVNATAAQAARHSPRRPRRWGVSEEHGLSRLLELHATGASAASIAAALNSEGFRTPAGQRWHGVRVTRVVAEAFDAGRGEQARREAHGG